MSEHTSTMSRRNFVTGATFAAAAAGVLGGAQAFASEKKGSAQADAGALTYDETIAWDGEYDVVIVGFGAAGGFAALSAVKAGANVLLIDKAPEGHEGGNTRYCGQCFINGHGDLEATQAYYRKLYGELPVPEAMFETYTRGITDIADNITEALSVDKADLVDAVPEGDPVVVGPLLFLSPEYPEFIVNDSTCVSLLHAGSSDGYLWNTVRQRVTENADHIDVWFESPATRLIYDFQNKVVVGVEISRKGKPVNIRATNGVVLSCGGFENNPEMVKDYLGMAHYLPLGTLYNTGDGITMAQAIGADMWHMHAYETAMLLGGVSYMYEEGQRGEPFYAVDFMAGSTIFVGTDGHRILREDEMSRHGHVYKNGVWENVKYPTRVFIVWDQAKADEVAASGSLAGKEDQIVSAPTLTELAGIIGTAEGVLEQTVEDFNAAAETGRDVAFNRAPEAMRAFDGGPYYALELIPDILNTQGGPRRNENAEVLGMDGEPIGHLYSAGELGGICSNMYQGGGNIAECFIFGTIAGQSAAAAKGTLPTVGFEAAQTKELTYTIGAENDLTAKVEVELADNERLGTGTGGIGGDIIVKVAFDGDTMSAIEVVKQNETDSIGGKALPTLVQEVLDAQSTEVDTVAGATVTSKAFLAAVADAVSQK